MTAIADWLSSFRHWSAGALGAATIGVAVFGVAFEASGAPVFYSAEEIRGTVVDAETKQPVEGVHVVARWLLFTVISPWQMHRGGATPLQIMEAVTNARGEYYFPAWGPKLRPVLSRLDWGEDPMITFFKPGYVGLDRTNYSPPPDNEAEISHRISRWHQRTVEVEPFRGTPREWAGEPRFLQMRFGWGDEMNDLMPILNDYWKYMPGTVLAIADEQRRLPADIRYKVLSLDSWNVTEAELRGLAKQKQLFQ